MSLFERYLTVWVGLCIVVGVALGHVLPGVFQTIGVWGIGFGVGLLVLWPILKKGMHGVK